MKKSKLLIGIGVCLALAGIVYFMSPSPNTDGGVAERTPFTGLMSAWMLASGIGLILHKYWSFLLYAAGVIVLMFSVIFFGIKNHTAITDIFVLAALMAGVFGIPALLMFALRHHLEPIGGAE